MKSFPYRCVSFWLFCVLPFCCAGQDSIKIKASDLLKDALQETVNQQAVAAGLVCSLDFPGSIQSRQAILDGSADLVILAMPKGEKIPEGMLDFAYTFQVAVFIVNQTNPLDQISLPELAAIFGAQPQRNVTNWSDLNLGPAWNNRAIGTHAVRNPHILALEIFRHAAVRESPMKLNVIYHEDPAAVLAVVGEDPNALGLVPAVPLTPKVKSLSVSENPDNAPFPPTPQNIQFGDYPPILSFHIIYRPDRVAALKPVLKIFLSDLAATALSDKQFVPLPKEERSNRSMLIDLQ